MDSPVPDESRSKEFLNLQDPIHEECDGKQDDLADTVNLEESGDDKEDHPMINSAFPDEEDEKAWGNASAWFSDEEEKRVLFGALDSFRYASILSTIHLVWLWLGLGLFALLKFQKLR